MTSSALPHIPPTVLAVVLRDVTPAGTASV